MSSTGEKKCIACRPFLFRSDALWTMHGRRQKRVAANKKDDSSQGVKRGNGAVIKQAGRQAGRWCEIKGKKLQRTGREGGTPHFSIFSQGIRSCGFESCATKTSVRQRLAPLFHPPSLGQSFLVHFQVHRFLWIFRLAPRQREILFRSRYAVPKGKNFNPLTAIEIAPTPRNNSDIFEINPLRLPLGTC